tara:strand:+ start:2424 stop:2729 length:306 start_codon:yes stop_codon:yes gene_type:complete
MFTEEIVQEGNLFKITVSIKKRKYAYEKKLVHEGNVDNLIPPELVGKIRLISAPRKKVSNMARGQYISSGTWVYEIIKATRRPRKKTSTTKPKNDIIEKVK